MNQSTYMLAIDMKIPSAKNLYTALLGMILNDKNKPLILSLPGW